MNGDKNMRTNESLENYLETILMLSERKPVVRSVDVANELGFTKPSVSVAVKNMKEANMITVSSEGYLNLTESGRKIAETIYERHRFFSQWLVSLGIDEGTAQADACRMEHALSPESFAAIKEYVSRQ